MSLLLRAGDFLLTKLCADPRRECSAASLTPSAPTAPPPPLHPDLVNPLQTTAPSLFLSVLIRLLSCPCRGWHDAASATASSPQPAADSEGVAAPQPASRPQLAFDPLGRPPNRRSKGRTAGASGSGARAIYSTARSRDLPPPASASQRQGGHAAGATAHSTDAWAEEYLGSAQAGSSAAQRGGVDAWSGLPVPPDVSDLSEEEVSAMMGRLLEQFGQAGAAREAPMSVVSLCKLATAAAFAAYNSCAMMWNRRHCKMSECSKPADVMVAHWKHAWLCVEHVSGRD